MTMIIDGSAGVTFPNSTVQASAGSVIQVVNAIYSTQASTTGSTPVTSGLTASITPKFSTSKILVLINPQVSISTTGADYGCAFYIYRSATQIYADTNLFDSFYSNDNNTKRAHLFLQYLDSPATTSSISYTLYFASYQGTTKICDSSAKSIITLMEIAG